jgi:glycosyltransferase involved in cell wall biosynthesis
MEREMRVAVFNRYWATVGGGERYAGAFAEALATEHDVDLLSPTKVDWTLLEERLGLDLSRTTAREVPADSTAFTEITRKYDLLVTCSFMSTEFNGARRGIYVVLFPAQASSAVRAAKSIGARALSPMLARDDWNAVWGNGFHPAERSEGGVFRWTTDEADLYVTLPAGKPTRVRLTFLAYRPQSVPPATVVVEVDGRVRGQAEVGSDLRTVELDIDLVGRGANEPIGLVIRSDTFTPNDGGAAGDSRRLGVPLVTVQLGKGPRAWLMGRYPFLASAQPLADYLSTYQQIVSISEFTRHWVRRRWRRPSHVIYPPVTFAANPGQKEPLILSVGRFFDQDCGHSKKQLELVRAFRTLVSRGLTGWDLHLVGGCQQSHIDYLERVRAEAQGLPVHFHIDAPGKELRDLYRRASIYWHAAGFGESERRHPERLEHFGISTVEAMGAGAVPIVVGKAGQGEIVQHNVSGYHFRSLNDLASRTHQLAVDQALRQRLAAEARRQANAFSTEHFAAQVRALVRRTPAP